jgi:hypothetical protein
MHRIEPLREFGAGLVKEPVGEGLRRLSASRLMQAGFDLFDVLAHLVWMVPICFDDASQDIRKGGRNGAAPVK